MPVVECSGCQAWINPRTTCRHCGKEYTLEPKFQLQVGDKVRSVVGTVKRIAKNPDDTSLVFYVNDRGAERFLNEDELELVERPVKYKPGDKFLNFGVEMLYLYQKQDGTHVLWNTKYTRAQEFDSMVHMLSLTGDR